MIDYIVHISILALCLSVVALVLGFSLYRMILAAHKSVSIITRAIDDINYSVGILLNREAENLTGALSDEDLADYPVFGYPPKGDKNGAH